MSAVSVDFSSLSLDRDSIEQTIAPFVVERWPAEDPRFTKRYRRQLRKWRLKRVKRRLMGWMPKRQRTPALTKRKYDRIWAERPWPETFPPFTADHPALALWGDEGLLIRRYGLNRVHLLLMARIIRAMGARNVLEVGCGPGRNLFVLAAMLPEVRFTGVELSASGVEQAASVTATPELPSRLADYCPELVQDATAHRRVEVRQGSATDLPFETGSYDLVFTRQALEQMERIREPALLEIARVARSHVLMVEPFAEANQDQLRQTYVAAQEYFSLSVADLRKLGIDPVYSTHAFPQKITLGLELVVGRRMGN